MERIRTYSKYFIFMLALLFVLAAFSTAAHAEETGGEETEVIDQSETEETREDNSTGMKALAAAITVGLAAAAGAIGMGIAIAKSVEGISRQPEAEGKIRTSLMLGLVFVETAIIYALIVAVLIIFVV